MADVVIALAAGELAVLTGATLAAAGYGIRRRITRSDRDREADTGDRVDIILLQRDVTEIRDTVRANRADLDRLSSRVATHGEELIQIGQLVERHESWHERHDPR